MRVARGGEVLAPGRPERYVQFIDVRDLTEWIVGMIERKTTGIYNATGLPDNLTMGRVLEECKTVSRSDASFTWVSDDFLQLEKVAPWSEVPLWIPEEDEPLKGLLSINCDKAIGLDLRFRPVDDTIRSLLIWHKTNLLNEELKAGIDPEKEQRLLCKWHKTL